MGIIFLKKDTQERLNSFLCVLFILSRYNHLSFKRSCIEYTVLRGIDSSLAIVAIG